jgi:hypothetical protein
LGVLAASMVLAPAAAWACEEHDPEERERVAGRAGQTISVDIPNTLEGAEWAIRLKDADDDDDPLAKGEDESAEDGVEAEFEVPDLGADERDVRLEVAVTHEADGADWSYELELEYGGRPAPEPPKQAEPEPTPQPRPDERPPPAPQPEPDRSSDAKPAPAPASAAPPPPPPPPAPATPAQRALPGTPAASLLSSGGKTPSSVGDLLDGITAVGTGIPAAVAAAAAGPAPRAASRGSRSRARQTSRRPVPQALPGEPARPRPHEAPAEGGIRLPDVDLPGVGSGLAWTLIGGGSLAFALAGLGVAGLGRHRRQRRGGLVGS